MLESSSQRSSRSAEAAAKESAGLNPIFTMLFFILIAVLTALFLVAMMHLLRKWLHRRTWKQLVDKSERRYAEHAQDTGLKIITADPPRQVVMDAVRVTAPTPGTTHQVFSNSMEEAKAWLRAAQAEAQRQNFGQDDS